MDDFHCRPTLRTFYWGPFFDGRDHFEAGNPEHHLQKPDELFAARMEKAVASGSAKSFRQDMEHEQVEKFFASDAPGSVFSRFCVEVAEGNHAVFTAQDILFPENTPVQVFAEVDNGFVPSADVLAVYHPLRRAVFGYAQALVNKGLQKFCPENLCHGSLAEEITGGLGAP